MTSRLNLAIVSLAVVSLPLLACNKPEIKDPTIFGSESGTESNSSSGTGSMTTTTTTTTEPTTGGSEGGTGSSDSGFVVPTDMMAGPKPPECDPFKQDCPEGQACKPAASTPDDSWDTTVCTPLDANPGQVGDPCTSEGLTGVDSCDEGLLCWYFDGMGGGTCLQMCTGTMDNPMCPDGLVCDITNNGSLILCLKSCDPLAMADCPDTQICFFSETAGNFICDFDASGEMGMYGDPCMYINVCDYGLFCADAANVPGCPATGCCSFYCDLNDPNFMCPDADKGQECVPWYTMDAPPGQEHIGACVVPM